MRKRLVLIIAILLVFAGALPAQTKVALGLVVGGNYNVHTGSDLQKTGTGVGFVGGGQIDISFSKSIGLLTTIYAYDNRIGKYTYPVSSGGVDYSVDVSVTVAYAGVEPLLKFTMPDDRFFFVAGPSIGFKVAGQSEVTATVTTPGYSYSNGFASQTTTNDLQDINTRFELNAGAGYAFKIDPQSRLTSRLMIAYGLTNVEKNVDWRINSIRLVAALEFDLHQ